MNCIEARYSVFLGEERGATDLGAACSIQIMAGGSSSWARKVNVGVDEMQLSTLDEAMRFLAPGFLHLAWLLVIPVALYLYRREAKRQLVSTLLFFRVLAREHQEAAWLRQVKRWLSLLLTLLMWGLVVLALGRPIWSGGGQAGALVIVVDRSASMAAVDGDGVTRLDEAKRSVAGRLAQVAETVAISLVVFDARAEVVVSRSQNRREVLRLLEALTVRPMEGLPEAGWRLTERLLAAEPESEVWWVSDEVERVRALTEGKPAERMQVVAVGLERGVNVGITAFQVRALPMERQRSEGYLQVTAAAGNANSVTVRLEVQIDGRLAQLRELEMAPGQQTALTLPLEGAAGQRLEARVFAKGDCLGWDDAVVAHLPPVGALKVAWYAQEADPFSELAFQSLVDAGRIEMWRGDTQQFPPLDQPDVYVFENWLPKEWPQDRPVIALRPPQSVGPIKVRVLPGRGVPHPSVRVPRREHPVVFRSEVERVALTQSAVIELSPGLEGLWMVGNEAVLAAGEVEGQRLVIGAFHPARSEQLALLPALPLVLGNALLWCAADSPAQSGLNLVRTGEMMLQTGRVEWAYWDGEQVQMEVRQGLGWTEVDRVGAWVGEEGARGGSLLASTEETHLPFGKGDAAGVGQGLSEASTRTQSLGGGALPVVSLILLGLIAVLLAESYLFHRRAVF
jgi:hypothetical protein